ncbi:holin [Streptomyces sp. NPDC002537]
MPRFLLDLAERTAATYLEAFLGLLLAGTVTDLSTAKAAAVAAIPAALAIAKGALSGLLNRSGTASALPAPKTTAAKPTGPAAS